MNVSLVSPAPHDAQCLLQPGPCVRSSPPPRVSPRPDTRPAQFCGVGVAAGVRRREKAVKSHFMSRPCPRGAQPRGPSGRLSIHSTPRPTTRGPGHSQPLFSPARSLNSRGWHRRALGSKPGFWHLPPACCGQPRLPDARPERRPFTVGPL